MSGVPKIAIAESVERLKSLMKQQKTVLNYAKVQSLYLLKIQAAETVRYLAVIMGRSESTGRIREASGRNAKNRKTQKAKY